MTDEDKSTRVESIKKFMALFSYRDEMYSKLTGKIFDFFRDNIVSAFEDVLQLPEGHVKWMDTQLDLEKDKEALILSFSIKYTKQQANKFIVNSFGLDETEETNVRIIKFGVPLYFVFAPKNEVKDFILNVTDSDESDMDKSDSDKPSFTFDTSQLTEQQLEQLKLFETKGTKH